jgi:hypothetical protein
LDFVLGVFVGIILTLVVIGIGVLTRAHPCARSAVCGRQWLALRRSARAPLPEMPAFAGEPAVTVMLIEPFLNQQLREALAAETTPHAPAPEAQAARFKIQLDDATLDVQTGQRAKFYAALRLTAWNFHLRARPIADMMFGLQDGRVRIAVTAVRIAGLNVPRALMDRFVSHVVAVAEAKLNHSLLELQQDTRVQLSAIETTEDLLILKFAQAAGPAAVPQEGVK